MDRDERSKREWEGYYSAWARGYDGDVVSYGYRPAAILQRAARVLPLGPLVLDVGAGTSLWLPSRGSVLRGGRTAVVALDISQGMLLASRRRGALPVRGDAESLPFADGSFDSVVALELLEALPRPRAFLAEAARVLRPSGALVVTLELARGGAGLPGREVPGGRLLRHGPDEVASMLAEASLELAGVVRCRGFHVYDLAAFCARSPPAPCVERAAHADLPLVEDGRLHDEDEGIPEEQREHV